MSPHSTLLAARAALSRPLAAIDDPLAQAGVHIEVVDDAMDVRDERVVRVTTLRIVSPAVPSAPAATKIYRDETAAASLPEPRPDGLAALVGAKAWEQLRITVVDGHTVRIACGKLWIRRTYRDLGLYAENSREPTKKWTMLLAICAGHGTCRWRRFGGRRAVSQAVSVLRGKLKEAFGIEGDPFEDWDNGWKVRFFASSEVGEEDE